MELKSTQIKCNRCGGEMKKITNIEEGGLHKKFFEIEICTHCNHIWFDNNEQSYMTKESLVEVAKILLENINPEPIIVDQNKFVGCYKCGSALFKINNVINGNPFLYFMCPNECGLFLSFEDFLKLKNLIRRPKNSKEFENCDNDKFEDWEKDSIVYNIQKILNEEEEFFM